jgi:hypothetical protein
MENRTHSGIAEQGLMKGRHSQVTALFLFAAPPSPTLYTELYLTGKREIYRIV